MAASSIEPSKFAIRDLSVMMTNGRQNVTCANTMVANPMVMPILENDARDASPMTSSGMTIGTYRSPLMNFLSLNSYL